MADEKSRLLEKSKSLEETSSGCCSRVGARHILGMLSFFGFLNLFTLRVNLSVALVAMVNGSMHIGENISVSDECKHGMQNISAAHKRKYTMNGVFDWDEQTQGFLLGAFFYGYCLAQLPGGWLAERVGGKLLFGGGILIPAILSLLTPLATKLHITAVIVIRVLQGVAQGVVYPAMHSIWGRWAPVMERSRLVTVTYAGAQVGTVVAMLGAGYLCEYGFAGGWPSVFYVFGGMGCLWSILWFALVHDTPAQHPRILHSEREYIERSIGKHHEKLRPPWRKIFTSRALWAIAAAHVANDWGCFTTITCLPQYMKQVLRFDIQEDGVLSSLPYITLWFINTISGPIADFIRGHGYLSTRNTRKVMNSIGLLLPAGLMVGVGYAGCNPMLAVLLLCLGVGISGFTMSGYSVNHLDIAPKFAAINTQSEWSPPPFFLFIGILMGITNTFGTTTGFIGPAIVGALTNHNPSAGQWRIFFFITAGVFLFGGVVFALFAEGEEQQWYIEATKGQRLPRVLSIQEEDDFEDSENYKENRRT